MHMLSPAGVEAITDAVTGHLEFLRENERPARESVRAALDAAWVHDGGRPQDLGRPSIPDEICRMVSRPAEQGITAGTEALLLSVATPGELYSPGAAFEVANGLSCRLWHEGLCIEYWTGTPQVVPIVSYPIGVALYLSREDGSGIRVDMETERLTINEATREVKAVLRPRGFERRTAPDGEEAWFSEDGELVLDDEMWVSAGAQMPVPGTLGPGVEEGFLADALDASHARLSECPYLEDAPPMRRRTLGVLRADISESTDALFSMAPTRAARIFATFLSEATAAAGKHGGEVHQLQGDGAAFVFDAENDEGDSVQRMVDAAALIQCICGDTLTRHLRASGLPPVRCKCAIEVGAITYLKVGEDPEVPFGDPFHLAAKLEKVAEPGEILLGPSAARCAPRGVQARLQPAEKGAWWRYWHPVHTRDSLRKMRGTT